MTGLVLAAGAATWLVTLILVEGFVFAPVRHWVQVREYVAEERRAAAREAILRHKPDPRITVTGEVSRQMHRDLTIRERRLAKAKRRWARWHNAAYFVRCHLCLGVWVAAALTALPGMPRPFGGGVLGWALAALVVKAVAHLILEAAALVRRTGA